MKKNLLFLCLMLLLASVSGFAQGPTTVTIGTGTNDSYNLPINNYYKNSWSEMIYPASDITERGYITSIGFDVSSVVDGYMCNTLTIYMGVTSNEAHNSNADWLPMEALTEVYSSIDWPLPTATGWLTFDLDNPFQYESNDNLVIVVSKTMPNWTSGLKFRYTEGATNCCLYRRNDNDLSYASHPGANTGTLTNQLPNLQLTFSTTTDFCHAVTDFAVTDISAYEATFAWNAPEDASNYILQYTEYEDWESGDVVTVYPTETPYTLTNLVPNTRYNVRVANVCDNEYSSWRYTAFKTECVTISIAEAPYFEMFEGYTNYAFPDCWTRITGYTSGSTYYPAINNNNAFSGTGSLDLYGNADNPNVVALPQFVEDLNTLRLSFWMKPSSTNNNFLELGVMTDLTDNSTFTLLHSWSAAEIGSTNWAYYEMNLDTMNTPASGHLVFRQHIESGNYFCYLDDVRVMPIPACETPTGLAVAYVHTYSADLVWDNMSGTYNIYYKADTEDDYSSVNNVMVTDNGYELGNLAPETTYHVYVAAVCEDGSEAPSSSSVIFTTLCAHETTPYSEDFNASNSIPNCWEKFTGLVSDAFNGINPTPNSSTSGWTFGNTHVFGLFHPKVNIYGTGCRYWLVSPAIDLNGLENPGLTFELALTRYNNDSPILDPYGQADDRFMVLISTDDGATWSADNAIEWNNSGTGDYIFNQIPATGDEITIPLEQYAGQTIRIAFYGESTMNNGDNDLHIDNVIVGEVPICPRPVQLAASNISTHSAEISWVQKGDETVWVVEYGPSGFTPGSGTTINVFGESQTTLYELTPSSYYEFHVMADCGAGEFSAPKSATFRTADCEAITLPFTEDFESYTVSTTASTGIAPACWELMQEDVAMTDATRPQIYYKSTFAHSGDYSLKLHNRCIYAMPELSENIETKHVHLEMYLRQANSSYWLQAGVWEDDGTFVPVATFKNSTTDVEFVECDFSNYTGSGRRIAFRNVTGNGTHYDYSYNYIDDITLTESTLIPASLPYYTDFSENTDQNWRLKNGSCANYWMMGTPDEDTPNALFVTQDGATAGYDINNSSTVMAEKAFHMPASDYVHVEFDVQVGGQIYIDYLKVFLTSVEETFDAGEDYNTQSYNTYSENALDFSDYKSLTGYTNYPYILNLTNGNTLHISANMPNPHPNEIGKIVFLWRNNNNTGTQPGAVVTNFSIEETTTFLPPTVTTENITNVTENSAVCVGNVTDNSGFNVTERGVCWSTAPNPTLEDAYIVSGNGMGEFTCQLTDLTQGTTYYVRAYATNLAGTAYGEVLSFTACGSITLPFTEDFESYTEDTTATTGVEPTCWELMQEDVPMSDENRPQLYYKSSYANSGDYSLLLNYRGVYAMPRIFGNIVLKHVHLEMYLRQPRSYYTLEVGVWEDDGTFVPVATFNNSTTGMQHVECDFSNYTGNGHRIAFRNLNTNGDAYSYNYLDDITLTESEGCEITFEMHDSYGDGWNGNKILIHNDGTEKEVTLTSGHEGTTTVMVHNGSLDFEWVNGSYTGECSFTVIGPSCLYYEGSSMSPGIFHSMEMDCENGLPSISDFTYWTENTCNSVIVHFENNSTNAISAVWDFGDGATSEEYSPIHEYTEDGTYQVTLSVFNNTCEYTYSIIRNVEMTMPERLALPYSEDFESYTSSTTPSTGVEPTCWELVQEDVPMSDANRPQLYYKNSYAHSGDYSLMMNYRGIYAMPALAEYIDMSQIHLEMYLRQPKAYYALEVGVWEDGTFVPVATFNNSTTGVELVECDFSEYSGYSHRIAFRNLNTNGDAYSYNYLDDITLKFVIPAGDAQPCPGHETVTDYDGNVYNTVQIGEQCWMKENLRVTRYEDGVEIPLVSNIASVDIAYRYNPDNNGNNVPTYGYLYNWTAIMHGNASNNDNPGSVQGICPQGWHLPSEAEWEQLMNYTYSIQAYLCNGDSYVKALATQTGWYSSDNTCSVGNNPDENNATGFSALPAGLYSGWGNNYGGYNYYADFWSATQNDDWQAMLYHINYEQDYVDQYNNDKYDGKSVRCVLGEGYNLAAVTTDWANATSSNSAVCFGNVTYDGNTAVTERGVCWNTEPNPTLANAHTSEGGGTGVFTSTLTNLTEGATYYVRAYATNNMGTVYGDNVTFTTCGGFLTLPYTDNFDYYTVTTTPATGIEPACWELVQEDVPMSDANRPQLYYKSAYAHSGNYSLMLNYRGVYAMPSLSEDIPMNQVHLEMYLRQPRDYYALEVGIWENDDTFVPVATFNNSTTEVTRVECDFSGYFGDSHRIAFRNLNTNGDAYGYNYLDDITLKFAIPAGDAKPCPGHETVTDYDGNVYNTVKIGEQCWMKENLRVTRYEDGVEIPLVSDIASVDIAYRYNPDNNGDNVPTYGYLYNWAAIMHGNASNSDNPSIVQGICPQGWHLPSDNEWSQLMDYTYSVFAYHCNDDSYVKALAAQTGWNPNENTCSVGNNPDENNATGFSTLPAGLYSGWGNDYGGFNYYADFWSATENDGWQAMLYHINYEQDYVDQYSNDKYDGISVRCVLGEGYNLAAVTTRLVRNITSDQATCGGNVTYDGNTIVTERGVCWSTEPNPTLDYAYSVEGDGTGEFTIQLIDLWPATTYYVRAYATNSMGTVYGEEVSFTTCGGTLALPYSEDFENYTATTAASTGVEPACWELVQEDVEMPENKRPQLYYKSAFAHSGDYSLKMDYRGVYAMPPIEENMAMKHVHLGMYLRQPNAAYRLQVGVWDDATDTFTPVATFNNSTTEVEFVECDFSDYTGNGRRVAFRNVLASGANYAYSYNYLDDITLSETEGCELTVEMHSNSNPDWGGSLIRIYTDGSVKEVTLNNAYDDAVTVTVHNGMLDLEWVYNGRYPAEWMSFTVSGPCLYYSTERASYETEYFYSTELSCDGNGTTSIPDFDYWTENVCNNVVVHFENNSTDAEYSVWDFGDLGTSEEDNPSHEYTVSNVYPVTLSVHNVTCDEFSVIKKYIEVNMPDPITISLDTIVCAAELPLTWYGQEITHGGIYSTTLQTAAGCDSTVYMNFTLLESTFAHTPDTLVSANEPVTLWAAGSGDFVWTDADGNVIGEGNNITVIPTESTTYYVTKSGENQILQGNVVNGDFEYGTTGFSTQYSYYSQGACGCYYIDYDSYYWNWGYGNTTDHTTGSGLFMMVDATSYSNIWTQTVNVTPHTNYIFSAWFLTLSYANISYYVNGENITNFDFLETGNIWEQHSGTWYSGDNTTATLSINTEWADCGGYDFGIDDIMLYNGSCSSTESINVTLIPIGDAQPCPGTPTVSDIDGNVYNTVKIGNQCWMKENLKTTHYADGGEIALGEETNLSIPYRYAPGYEWDDHSYNVEAYGYLYNWAAVMNGTNSSTANPSGVQGICPDGWHVPSNAEWAQLTNYLSSEPVYQCGSSSEIAKALILPEGWNWWWDNECAPGYSNENTSGFNTTGFSIRPAGSYDGDYTININGNYYDFSSYAAFWSSTKSNTRNAWGIQLYCNNSNVYRYYFNKGNGFSVRCIYNEAIASVPTVETDDVTLITPTYATCGGNVANDGGIAVTERGVCWSTEHTPTMYDNHTIEGSGNGAFTSFLNDLMPNTTYYVRAYASNSMGTGYGQVMSFTTTTCEPITVPYFENFDEYTLSTTASTGVEPACWDLVQEDVAITETTRPQLYYKNNFAHSSNYSLKMGYRCVYAMPELDADISLNQLTLDMYLRQANAAYQLEVGVWDDETQTFEAVQLFNNSSTNVEHVTCDFANYTGNGHRIAFRNVLADGANFVYSYNYLDDITLTVTANKIAELTNANAMDADMMATDREMVDITVYPNPTRDYVNVQCTMNNLQCSGIEVVDVYGKIITTVDQSTVSVQTPNQINVSSLAAGMYFVRVTTDRGVVTKPFVKR